MGLVVRWSLSVPALCSPFTVLSNHAQGCSGTSLGLPAVLHLFCTSRVLPPLNPETFPPIFLQFLVLRTQMAPQLFPTGRFSVFRPISRRVFMLFFFPPVPTFL